MDKQAYIERRWIPVKFVCQSGEVVTIKTDCMEMDLPYAWVRDIKPVCLGCKQRIFFNSYQSQSGESFCPNCYRELDATDVKLHFGSPQWLSWDGQVSIRNMEDSHIANTLGRLKRNAIEAAELAGGRAEEYLHHSFKDLVDELHRRRPPDEQVKINKYLLYFWSILFMLFGYQYAKTDQR